MRPKRPAGFSYDGAAMTTRAGLEAEAISRLTERIEPREVRAILVQCLAGELAPSAAISRMLADNGATAIRLAIDDVTERAATPPPPPPANPEAHPPREKKALISENEPERGQKYLAQRRTPPLQEIESY